MFQWVIDMSGTVFIRFLDRAWMRTNVGCGNCGTPNGAGTSWYRGKVHHLNEVDALIAWSEDRRIGCATDHNDVAGCELLSINALQDGLGMALLSAAEKTTCQSGVTVSGSLLPMTTWMLYDSINVVDSGFLPFIETQMTNIDLSNSKAAAADIGTMQQKSPVQMH